MFKNIGIGQRLTIGFAITLLLSMLIAVISIWRLQLVAADTRDMMRVPLTKERLISDWYSKIDSGIRRTTAIAKSRDQELGAYFKQEAEASSKASAEILQRLESMLDGEAEKTLVQRVRDQRKVYLSSRDQIGKLKAAGQVEEAEKVFNDVFVPGSAQYQKLIQDWVKLQRDTIDANALNIDRIADQAARMIGVLAVLSLAFCVVCAWVLTRSIVLPLREAVGVAKRVASGDLSADITVRSGDECGQLLQALKDMNTSLQTIVGEVRNGTDHIASASSEIAAGNQDLSSRTEQQASSLEETASSIEELSSAVRHNADYARQAKQLAGTASQLAVKGGAVVAQVVSTMESINTSSGKIADIISVIDGIAFQTNILALNAAVEAARAGEQGRGFAVVAGEVRTLAQRSAAAAKEISALISDSVQQVTDGNKLVSAAGATMDEIVSSVQRVDSIIADITSATGEQSVGLDEVNTAVGQLDQVTQQNAALVEEAAAAAEAMQAQAARLAQVVSVFRLGSDGGAPLSGGRGLALVR